MKEPMKRSFAFCKYVCGNLESGFTNYCQLEGSVCGCANEETFEQEEIPDNCKYFLEYTTVGVERLDINAKLKHIEYCKNREEKSVKRTMKRIELYDKQIKELKERLDNYEKVTENM